MKINNRRMEKILYNRVDAKKWMTVLRLSEIPRTSFFDVNNLVLFDKKLLGNVDVTKEEIDFSKMFEEL